MSKKDVQTKKFSPLLLHMCKQGTFPSSYACTSANKEYFFPQLLKKPGGNEFEDEKCMYGNVSFRDTNIYSNH